MKDWLRGILGWMGFALILALGFGAVTADRGMVFVGDAVLFVDADCYSRMTRVAAVMEAPGLRVGRHDFENFPDGTEPHTTSLMDYLIAVPAWLIGGGERGRDLAGAWISPALGLGMLAFFGVWLRAQRVRFWWAGMLVLAVSPAVAQAFQVGRPDHQSLTIALLAAALLLEARLWGRPGRGVAVGCGLMWGFAFWTTLFEPVVLFLVLMVVRVAVLRGRLLTRDWAVAGGVMVGVCVIALLVDGWKLGALPDETVKYFGAWSRQIGELTSVPLLSAEWFSWVGWLLPAIPIGLLWRLRANRDEWLVALLVLLVVTFALTVWQVRWAPFFVLCAAMALPRAMEAVRWPWVAAVLVLIGFYPVAAAWDAKLFPEGEALQARRERMTDGILLREMSIALRSDEPRAILAPWWLSPAIAYWSGHPCVAGSSHQSLPGIVDSARFYLSDLDGDAAGILQRRRVTHVVAYEPDRVMSTSEDLLDAEPGDGAMGDVLYRESGPVPLGLRKIYTNPYFKVYSMEN